MNPELKAKWIAALRSGEYKQGKSALVDSENNYCCLGVLCAVAELTKNGCSFTYNETRFTSYAPEWLFDERIPREPGNGVEPGRAQGFLILMNDTKDYSFWQIADWIEENL